MSIDQEAVRQHIKDGGQYDADVVAGHRFGSESGDVFGIQVKTRGRVKPANRWHKEFVVWGNLDDTATSLWAKWRLWLAEGEQS